MVGTKQEIIAMLQEMQSIEDDETILIDLWTMKDFRDQAVTERSDEDVIEAMKCVDNDMKNEISYATISFAMTL